MLFSTAVLPLTVALLGGATPATSLTKATSEYFLITQPGESGEAAPRPVAVVVLRTLDRSPHGGEADFLLEREVIFAEGGLRVCHTESGTGDHRRLVWRELLPTSSRTWVADWQATPGAAGQPSEVHSISYGWHRPTHEVVTGENSSCQPLVGPLELLHGMRQAPEACSDRSLAASVIDPRTASIARVERRQIVDADGVRTLVAERIDDGSRVFRAVSTAQDQALSSALFDGGGVTSAEPIDRTRFERLQGRWTVESKRPYTAALSLVPRREDRDEAYWEARQKLFEARAKRR